MLKHKFAAGDVVSVLHQQVTRNIPQGPYKIVRVLPVNGLDLEYRAKSTVDGHERVLNDGQIGAG